MTIKTYEEIVEEKFGKPLENYVPNENMRNWFKAEITNLLKEREAGVVEKSCPPHDFIPYHYEGAWGGSTPPPNMKCRKCLMTEHF